MFNKIKNILAARNVEYNTNEQKALKDRSIKERNHQMVAMFRASHTLEDIAKDFNLTRERVRQILNYNMDDYDLQCEKNKATRKYTKKQDKLKVDQTCQFSECGKTFHNVTDRKYCSKDCLRKSRSKIQYPDWVAGRPIQKKYFTEDEWRKINAFRAKAYYHANKEKQRKYASDRYKADPKRQYLYYKRCVERKKYGKAITPLPGEPYYNVKP